MPIVRSVRTNPSGKRRLATVNLPIPLAMITNFQQPVFGIVALAAIRADQITAPCSALVIVVLRNRERRSAAAWNQKHSQRRRALGFFGFTAGLHP